MNEHRKAKAMMIIMAREDPSAFLQIAYKAGLDDDEREQMKYLIRIARRAPGYDAERDPFLKTGS